MREYNAPPFREGTRKAKIYKAYRKRPGLKSMRKANAKFKKPLTDSTLLSWHWLFSNKAWLR